MKFKLAFIFTILIIYFTFGIESRKLRRTTRHRNHRHRQNPPKGVQSNNLSYQFLMGALAEISGAYSLIDKCSATIPGWATVTNDSEEKKDSIEDAFKPVESKWDKILGYFTTALEYVCKLKDKIINYFTKQNRRWYRLFLQGKTVRRFRWSISDFIKNTADSIKSVGSAIAAGAVKIGKAVVDGVNVAAKKASEVAQFIIDKIKGVLQPVFDLFESIKQKWIDFLDKNPILKMWFNFCKCFIAENGISAIKGLKEKLTNFVATIGALTTPVGWVKLCVNLICGWEETRDAINFYKVASKEKQKTKKYNFYGRMAGKLFNAIAG